MVAFKTRSWSDYELIDCGNGKKLERFGSKVLIRPEHKAIWKPGLDYSSWQKQADAEFKASHSQKGEWISKSRIEPWQMNWSSGKKDIRFNLELTKFKHVGIFPEQSVNWHTLSDAIPKLGKDPRILNLFAYTGAASLVSKAAGGDVYHVDSVRQVISWAKRNMELSNISGIRWVLEDAFKFANRERKRGNKYQVIIMDPPAYGIGARGERWKIEDSIQQLMDIAMSLLDPKRHLLIVNTYTPSISPSALLSVYRSVSKERGDVRSAELTVESKTGMILPFGATLQKVKL